ncbi:hypothetical protein Cpir12675_003006 [Ceratocystis pirilliformis]|uniref:Alkyl hydroperoxide reductase subunit C/ Thiol specific antioxidant domain-containing protein n=1 Tax=Ceratocystis pirilliformis TaxID=259994 RepID=A0ABR3Z5S2_9PEZI
MFSSLATKIALKKSGLPAALPNLDPNPKPRRSKTALASSRENDDGGDGPAASWPAWMSIKALPLAVQPWFTPAPPPVPIAALPEIGHLAPQDRDHKLLLGDGRNVLVVFLRCVGCAFAQQTFLQLRDISQRAGRDLNCIAISHSSSAATAKWLSILGGARSVQVIIDEERLVYAAWGLGLASVWHMFNPTTQAEGWRQKDGWLGQKVASSITRPGLGGKGKSLFEAEEEEKVNTRNRDASGRTENTGLPADDEGGPSSAMGNKWQTAGAWAVNGRGVVIWGGQAKSADDTLNLYDGCRSLGL